MDIRGLVLMFELEFPGKRELWDSHSQINLGAGKEEWDSGIELPNPSLFPGKSIGKARVASALLNLLQQ